MEDDGERRDHEPSGRASEETGEPIGHGSADRKFVGSHARKELRNA